MSLEQEILKIIETPSAAPFKKSLLWVLSQGYRAGVNLRNFLYDKELLLSKAVPALVLSVGNIAVGGTGKTPLIELLAEEFSAEKVPLAILSRGYRSKAEKAPIPLKLGVPYLPSLYGDEPALLASKLAAVPIWVGRDRVKSAEKAVAEGAKLLLLDDGMQHRQLHRDFDLVVVNGLDPLAKNFYLPRGLLRDSPRCLKRAQLIAVNGITSVDQLEKVGKILHPYTSASLVGVHTKIINEEKLKGKRLGVFCAIGQPARFIRSLKAIDVDVAAVQFQDDHQSFSEKALKEFADRAKTAGAQALVCTEKDAIKIDDTLIEKLALPLIVAKSQCRVTVEKEKWQEFIHNILQHVKEKK